MRFPISERFHLEIEGDMGIRENRRLYTVSGCNAAGEGRLVSVRGIERDVA